MMLGVSAVGVGAFSATGRKKDKPEYLDKDNMDPSVKPGDNFIYMLMGTG